MLCNQQVNDPGALFAIRPTTWLKTRWSTSLRDKLLNLLQLINNSPRTPSDDGKLSGKNVILHLSAQDVYQSSTLPSRAIVKRFESTRYIFLHEMPFVGSVCLGPVKVSSHARTVIDWHDACVSWHLHSADASKCAPDGHRSTTKAIDADRCRRCRDMPKRLGYAARLKATIGRCFRLR